MTFLREQKPASFDEEANELKLYLVRHGETDWNCEQRLQGRTDIPLNTKGLRQAHQLANHLRQYPIQRILTSPLRRALTTSDIIATYIHCPLHIEEELIEIDHGVWQGLTIPVIRMNFVDQWSRWEAKPTKALVPEAESPTEVRSRVIKLLSRLEAQHVCLVTHGVVLQILLTHLLGKPLDHFPRFSLPNASLYLVQPGQELEFLQI